MEGSCDISENFITFSILFCICQEVYLLVFLTNHVERAGLSLQFECGQLCEVRIISLSVTTSVMPMLDNIFIKAVFCALLYRCCRLPLLRLQRNAATTSYQTMQPGSFWRQAPTFQTVSWGSERTLAGGNNDCCYQSGTPPAFHVFAAGVTCSQQFGYIASEVELVISSSRWWNMRRRTVYDPGVHHGDIQQEPKHVAPPLLRRPPNLVV